MRFTAKYGLDPQPTSGICPYGGQAQGSGALFALNRQAQAFLLCSEPGSGVTTHGYSHPQNAEIACAKTLSYTAYTVESIAVTSEKGGVSPNPPPFEGGREYPFSVTNSPNPDKHFVIFYKDVVNTSTFTVQDFDITLTATVQPANVPTNKLELKWSKISGPDSGVLIPGGNTAIFRNPKVGGVYRFALDLESSSARQRSEAVLVLPLSGAEVDSLIAANLSLADAFATKVVATYSWRARQSPFNGIRWFNNDGAGDHLGRPDNGSSSTVWYYNQVNRDGFAAVCTWKGKPIRTAKLNNFMVAYGARKIGVLSPLAWVAQIIGTQNDDSATKSWDAGWSIGGGSAYGPTVETLVSDIWDDDDDPNHKNMKLWPNPTNLDNYVAPDLFYNPDKQFTVPGFLYMESP